MVSYFAVLHAHDIDRLEVNLAMSWSNAKERSFMRAVVGLVRRHLISVGKLPVDFGAKIGECRTHVGVELSDPRLVRSGARLRCVVNEVIGEQFFEHLEVPLSLNFFGITAADSLRRIA